MVTWEQQGVNAAWLLSPDVRKGIMNSRSFCSNRGKAFALRNAALASPTKEQLGTTVNAAQNISVPISEPPRGPTGPRVQYADIQPAKAGSQIQYQTIEPPTVSEGVTHVGKIVAACERGTGFRVIVNAGTEQNE